MNSINFALYANSKVYAVGYAFFVSLMQNTYCFASVDTNLKGSTTPVYILCKHIQWEHWSELKHLFAITNRPNDVCMCGVCVSWYVCVCITVCVCVMWCVCVMCACVCVSLYVRVCVYHCMCVCGVCVCDTSTFIPSLVPAINRFYYRLLYAHQSEKTDLSHRVFNFDCLFHQYVMEWAIPR